MSSTRNGQKAGADMSTPLTVLGLLVTLWASTYVFIGAGAVASLLSGNGLAAPASGTELFAAPIGAVRDGAASEWPGVPDLLLWISVGVTFVAIFAVIVWALVRFSGGGSDDPLLSLAQPHEMALMMLKARRRDAKRLRPSLAETATSKIAPAEVGIFLGRLKRHRGKPADDLYGSLEDVGLAIMAPRAGKTTGYGIPIVLDAPGAVVATSNKNDLVAATLTLRGERTGERVWIFDPLHIAGDATSGAGERTWWWNPLRLVRDDRDAARLASHFIQEVDSGGKDKFWTNAAEDILTACFLAAATSGGSLTDVSKWVSEGSMRPHDLLLDAGHEVLAASYRGRLQGAEQTVQGIFENARTALRCLRSSAIRDWVTPPPGRAGYPELEEFREEEFVESRQCLHMLSSDRDGAAPLIAAFVDSLMTAGMRIAERKPRGRLDPPMTFLLDEAANICKIKDLPQLYSHLGSRGMLPLTILQSYPQGEAVWGREAMRSLWSAATVKIIGAGIDDQRTAEEISVLLGEHDVLTTSHSSSGTGRSSSTSTRRQRVMTPGQVRQLDQGTALVMATGRPVAWVKTIRSFERPDADQIAACTQTFYDRAYNSDNGLYDTDGGTGPRREAPDPDAGLVDTRPTKR